jgi:hypothetical protein
MKNAPTRAVAPGRRFRLFRRDQQVQLAAGGDFPTDASGGPPSRSFLRFRPRGIADVQPRAGVCWPSPPNLLLHMQQKVDALGQTFFDSMSFLAACAKRFSRSVMSNNCNFYLMLRSRVHLWEDLRESCRVGSAETFLLAFSLGCAFPDPCPASLCSILMAP